MFPKSRLCEGWATFLDGLDSERKRPPRQRRGGSGGLNQPTDICDLRIHPPFNKVSGEKKVVKETETRAAK